MTTPLAIALKNRLTDRTARVGVVGLGYVGLPLLVEFARSGFEAIGFDLDAAKVTAIAAGRSYIPDVPDSDVASCATPDDCLRRPISPCSRASTRSTSACRRRCERRRIPDMSYVVSAVETIAAHLRPGMLVILESTTYPGTTDELVRPILETRRPGRRQGFLPRLLARAGRSGQPALQHAECAEGRRRRSPDLRRSSRRRSTARRSRRSIPVSSPRVAEMVKLLENTFRAVNIGLVNEIALMCDALGIDVWEVVDAAATKPFGFMPFYPGPGLGGHCIPIDPFYLSWKAKQSGFEARFIELAGQVNGSMPHAVVQKIADALNTRRKSVNGARILIAGVAYKRDVDDMRESPSLDVMHMLQQRGADDQLHRSLRAEAGSRPWRVRPRVDRSPRRAPRCVRSTPSRSSPITRCSTTARSSSTRISLSTPATRSRIGRRTSSGWAHQHMLMPQRPGTQWAREHPSSRYEAGSDQRCRSKTS